MTRVSLIEHVHDCGIHREITLPKILVRKRFRLLISQALDHQYLDEEVPIIAVIDGFQSHGFKAERLGSGGYT
jgi:hypothetical protein